ncbi:MAG TPA: hypothetical protein VGF80_10320 [Galbitalea sp.]|jgi:hypothetical protein
MLGTIWGWVTAVIGAVATALLITYGTESGNWVDEHAVTNAPSVLGLLIVTGLNIVLFIGGVVVGLVGTVARRTRAH